jgi:hypothetical protein
MKRSLALIVLVGANVILLCVLVGMAFPPPAAQAQAVGGAGNYLMVCGNIQSDLDAVYMIDLRNRLLHTFTVRRGQVQLEYRGTRDLNVDFRN